MFRPSHLEVLENYFNTDSYPSQEKRDEIARACNGALDMGKFSMDNTSQCNDKYFPATAIIINLY